jgi:integrase
LQRRLRTSVDEKLGREEGERWTLHDLRRTVATGLQRLGTRFEVTEALLNHVSGAKSGVAGVYQRHDWKTEKRAALLAWARELDRIVTGKR